MSNTKGLNTQQRPESNLLGDDVPGSVGGHDPRKMTVAQNVILTIKVLAGFAVVGAAVWAIELWKSAQ